MDTTTATLEFDYIELDTPAWVGERTAGELDDLNVHFANFDAALMDLVSFYSAPSRLERLRLFISARAGKDWSDAEFAILGTEGDTGIVSLSDNVIVYRYIDPEHGAVAFVTEINGTIIGDSRAYTDVITDSGTWCTIEAQIGCPHHHGWTYRNGHLLDETGTIHDPADIFPEGQIITHDDNGTPRILCPHDGAPCQISASPL